MRLPVSFFHDDSLLVTRRVWKGNQHLLMQNIRFSSLLFLAGFSPNHKLPFNLKWIGHFFYFWKVLFSFSLTPQYFLTSLVIYSLTHESFKSILYNSQMLDNFPVAFSLLFSNLIFSVVRENYVWFILSVSYFVCFFAQNMVSFAENMYLFKKKTRVLCSCLLFF